MKALGSDQTIKAAIALVLALGAATSCRGQTLPAMPKRLSLTYQASFTPSYSLAGAPANFQPIYWHADWAGRAILANHDAECYMDSSVGENPFIIDIGTALRLVATPVVTPNPCFSLYNSGMVTTQAVFSQQYGYFEITARLPAGQGLWPAFWMLNADNGGAYVGEIDVFENPQGPNTAAPNPQAIHVGSIGCCGTSGATTAVGSWLTTATFPAGFNPYTAYHRYGVDWEPTSITSYIDHVPQASWPTQQSLTGIEMYMIANLAVGGYGSWPGLRTATTPAYYDITAIKAWATPGTISVNGMAYVKPPKS